MEGLQLARQAAEFALEKKANDIVILDLKEIVSFTDYFVICGADSDTQVKAIAENMEKKLRDMKIKPYHREGYDSLQWVLLDYIDVVVHVFLESKRAFYSLEKLYLDAEKENITEENHES